MIENINHPITKIEAVEIADSSGKPTIKVVVYSGAESASFSVPSGASTGAHEAHVLKDGDGHGVSRVIEKVNKIISEALIGKNVFDQQDIDKTMISLDGTPHKDVLGGNGMIGVSIACAKLAAKLKRVETYEYLRTLADIKTSRRVPHLYMNLLEGGKHVHNNLGLAVQEYHLVTETENVEEGVETGMKIVNSLKEMIKNDFKEEPVLGDEGGFSMPVFLTKVPLEYLRKAIKKNNLEGKVRLAIDVAASEFFDGKFYKIDGKDAPKEELLRMYNSLIDEFNLLSIEDGFDQEDFESFAKLRDANTTLLVVGDDLTVSNVDLLKKAIENKSINAMIIKPNQIGTLSETLATMELARKNGIELIVSHRGEETDDDFIADLAYAFGCFGFKAGAPTRPERMVKYKRLIEISQNY